MWYLSGNFTSFFEIKLSYPVLTFSPSLERSRRNFKSRAVPHWIISLRTERRGFPSNCRHCRWGKKPNISGNLDTERTKRKYSHYRKKYFQNVSRLWYQTDNKILNLIWNCDVFREMGSHHSCEFTHTLIVSIPVLSCNIHACMWTASILMNGLPTNLYDTKISVWKSWSTSTLNLSTYMVRQLLVRSNRTSNWNADISSGRDASLLSRRFKTRKRDKPSNTSMSISCQAII